MGNSKDTIPLRVLNRYENACYLCYEKHREIFGESGNCQYREKNEYCPEIMEAEKTRLSQESLSDHMERYLDFFNTGNISSGYSYIKTNIDKFTKEELLAIITAFDYSIHPKLVGLLNIEQINKIYADLDGLVRNEFHRGSSEETPR